MKKLSSVLLSIVLAASALFPLAGCGGGDNGPSQSLQELGYQYEDTSAPIIAEKGAQKYNIICLLYTSPSPRDA